MKIIKHFFTLCWINHHNNVKPKVIIHIGENSLKNQIGVVRMWRLVHVA